MSIEGAGTPRRKPVLLPWTFAVIGSLLVVGGIAGFSYSYVFAGEDALIPNDYLNGLTDGYTEREVQRIGAWAVLIGASMLIASGKVKMSSLWK